jgi:hypothetical protein
MLLKVHQIVGGNAFNATMTGDIGEQGTCTTCVYTEGMVLTLFNTPTLTSNLDFSNYWTAAMYFKHENGSYKRVPIYPNAQLGESHSNTRRRDTKGLTETGYEGQDTADIKGGMTIYYTQKDFNSSDLENHITAFPPVRHPMTIIQDATDRTTGLSHDRW